ncbi:MAG: PqiC family protein [Thiohalocapsa sp.]|jgi:hypothetical protein
MKPLHRPFGVLALAAVVLIGGCATPTPVRFYTLSPASGGEPAEPLPGRPSLAVGPVDVPEYLDRPQLVTRLGNSELQVHEFNRWAGQLQEDVARVIARNLGRLLDTPRVHLYPSRVPAATDYRVIVELRALEGRPGGRTELDAAWGILRERDMQTVYTGFTRAESPAAGDGFSGYVGALSGLLGQLSRDIAAELRRLAGRGTGDRRPAVRQVPSDS